MFELGVLCEVFGLDRTDERSMPPFTFITWWRAGRPAPVLLTPRGGQLRAHPRTWRSGRRRPGRHPGGRGSTRQTYPRGAARDDPARRTARGATIPLSICTGAFVLAGTGLLDGPHSATHWRYAAIGRRPSRAPGSDLDVLYIEEGSVITGAGTAAGIDACLHLVAASSARRLRPGSPDGWWCRRTATAGSGSSSRPRSRPSPARGCSP